MRFETNNENCDLENFSVAFKEVIASDPTLQDISQSHFAFQTNDENNVMCEIDRYDSIKNGAEINVTVIDTVEIPVVPNVDKQTVSILQINKKINF